VVNGNHPIEKEGDCDGEDLPGQSDDEERESLLKLIGCGKSSARKVNRAHILLLTDKGKVD